MIFEAAATFQGVCHYTSDIGRVIFNAQYDRNRIFQLDFGMEQEFRLTGTRRES